MRDHSTALCEILHSSRPVEFPHCHWRTAATFDKIVI
jgi:hypothetical protein